MGDKVTIVGRPRLPLAVASVGLGTIAGVASVIAGFAHYGAAAQHLPEQGLAALMFTLIGAFQLVWPALPGRGRRWVAIAAVAVNSAAVLAWLLTRTVALPFGHHAGEVQPVGLLDAGAAAAELVVIVAAGVLLRHTWRTSRQAPPE